MEKKTNNHVERLHKYLPFSPAHDQIYEEYQKSEDSLNIPTKALEYLISAVRKNATLVVLTGDAGHGKTHLCRRLIEDYLGYSEDKARQLIITTCDGDKTIEPADDHHIVAKPLRIYKDFSEMSVGIAVNRMEMAINDENEVTVICANEGRLRAILESGHNHIGCSALLTSFKESFEDGLASRDGKTHIINLNYQSVASEREKSLISIALNNWVSGTKWRTCKSCSSQALCPISRNQEMLSTSISEKAENRKRKLEQLFATLERLGIVITIREVLMVIAYLLTGGLRCKSVHRKLGFQKQGWQHHYAFYNLLFNAPKEINRDKLDRISVLKEFSLINPGNRASREIDEHLINVQGNFEEAALDTIFAYRDSGRLKCIDAANGIDEVIGNPRSRVQRTNEATFIRDVVSSLRRRAFFDQKLDSMNVMGRMGFDHSDGFLDIIKGNVSPQRMKALKNKIVAGLHTMQGLQMGKKETTLYIVEPAFGRAGSHAAIIASQISTTNIKLIPMSSAWEIDPAKNGYSITESIDWLERYVVLRVVDDGKTADLALDLMMFDFICQAGSGYVAEEFYAHDVRKVVTFLGRLAASDSTDEQDIRIFINGHMHSVSIDQGVIQVGGY